MTENRAQNDFQLMNFSSKENVFHALNLSVGLQMFQHQTECAEPKLTET